MKTNDITTYHNVFEQAVHHDQKGVEFWYARELQRLLDYSEWRGFSAVIDKAEDACNRSAHKASDHFVADSKMVAVGSGAERELKDMKLTRFACYLIAQNGNPQKEVIAFAQSYFAVQTRKIELIEERIALAERLMAREKLVANETELSKLIYERGVDNRGFANIRSKGDAALFGGKNTAQMKRKLGIADNRPLADFLPLITIKAKDFATEITNFNVRKSEMYGEGEITYEHVKNNLDVRAVLAKSGIRPERLAPAEDIKKVERRLKSEDKKLLKDKKD